MNDQHPTDLLPAFALSCLDADERKLVRTHLATCDVCKTELSELKEVIAMLAQTAPPAEPPNALKTHLIAKIRPRATYAWFDRLLGKWPRLIPAATITAVTLTVVLGASQIFLFWHNLTTSHAAIESIRLIRLQPTPHMPDANGALVIDTVNETGMLVVDSLKELDRARQYQLWLIKDSQRTSAGTFSVSPRGNARLVISARQRLTAFDSFGITIEPYGGSSGPTGEKVLGGKMVM